MNNNALLLTAHLHVGFISNDPWSPAIDGILAAMHMQNVLGDQYFINQGHSYQMEPVDDLPLEKTHWNDLWWYNCSCPVYTPVRQQTAHLHRRFNAKQAEDFADESTKTVLTKAGVYKNARLTYQQKIVKQVYWHVIGEKSKIESLLSRCHHVGARRGSGFGRVKKWTVETEGADENMAKYYRPLPAGAVDNHERVQMEWGIRPPARIPQNVFMCAMPIS